SRSASDVTRRSSSTHWPLRLPSSLSTTKPSASAFRILITLTSRATKVPWPTADASSRPICGRLNYLSMNRPRGSALWAAVIFRSSRRPRDLASWFRRRSALAEDAELPHPAAQRVWIEVQDSCGVLRSLDDAVGMFEHGLDVLSFGVSHRRKLAGATRRFWSGECLGVTDRQELGVDGQHGAGRQNNGALADVLELAYVAGPLILRQQRPRVSRA